jgi:hypothetical protein
MTDDRQRHVLTWEPVVGERPRRLVFEPAPDDRWHRIEQERRGCQWRDVGRETVASLSVHAPAE